MTAENRPSELDRARDLGAAAVLVKPVSREALLKEIQRLIGDQAEQGGPGTERQTAPTARSERRKPAAKAYPRFETTTPPARPPELVCPSCDAPLAYEHSHIGGVSSRHPEQWDYYACPASCGRFVYRQRTRRLRLAV